MKKNEEEKKEEWFNNIALLELLNFFQKINPYLV